MDANCEHLSKHEGLLFCGVAQQWAEGIPVPVTEAACKVCMSCSKPKQLNRVTVSIAVARIKTENHDLWIKKQPEMLEHFDEPTLPEKARRYISSTVDWLEQGRPQRTDEEVKAILKICRSCDEWENHSCRLCGCNIDESSGWTNKARRITEHCPKGHW